MTAYESVVGEQPKIEILFLATETRIGKTRLTVFQERSNNAAIICKSFICK